MDNSGWNGQKNDENSPNQEVLKTLESDILSLKNVILRQNEIIKQITERVVALSEALSSLKKPFSDVSTGNDGVKQTNKQTNKQTLSTDFLPQNREGSPENPKYKQIPAIINKTFSQLSRQELKTFLTIYQLEDEKIDPSYAEIAVKMSLSEACVRLYASNLLRKSAPIIKRKINNKKSLFFIDSDFKSLNLKKHLIQLYYSHDLSQSTLLDLEQ